MCRSPSHKQVFQCRKRRSVGINLLDLIQARKQAQVDAYDKLKIPHEDGFLSIQIRTLRHTDLEKQAVFEEFRKMKVGLGDKFILRVRYVDFFLDTLLSFVHLFGAPASVRLFSSGSFASRIANPGYWEAVHGLVDDACSLGSTKKDAITLVFHIVYTPDQRQQWAEFLQGPVSSLPPPSSGPVPLHGSPLPTPEPLHGLAGPVVAANMYRIPQAGQMGLKVGRTNLCRGQLAHADNLL